MVLARHNPEDIHIAFRLLTSILPKLSVVSLESALEDTVALLKSSPQAIKWSEVDKLFESWLYKGYLHYACSSSLSNLCAMLR